MEPRSEEGPLVDPSVEHSTTGLEALVHKCPNVWLSWAQKALGSTRAASGTPCQ